MCVCVVCTALSVAAFSEFKILCFVCLRDSYFSFLPSSLEWHDIVNRVLPALVTREVALLYRSHLMYGLLRYRVFFPLTITI